MNKIKSLVINQDFVAISRLVILVSIAAFAPLVRNQLITGSLVNAVLFISACFFGFRKAALVAFFPSLIALTVGLLPLAFLPLIPFIILGNLILLSVFNLLKRHNYWQAVFTASFFKFGFLFLNSQTLINLLNQKVANQAIVMMSWFQLATALMGGLIAFFVLRFSLKNS